MTNTRATPRPAIQGTGSTAAGAIANLAAQGIPFVLLLVVTPILLRILGREQYGALVLFNLVPQIAGQLDLGLSTAATRGFTQHSARGDASGARTLFREALAVLVLWGCVLGGLFYWFHASIADGLKLDTVVADESFLYLSAAIAIPLALANNGMLVPLRALERYGAVARIQVASGVLYWTVCVAWAARGGSLAQLVTLGTAIVAVTTIAFYYVGEQHVPVRTVLDELPVRPGASSTDPAPLDPSSFVRPALGKSQGVRNGDFLLRPYLRIGGGAFLAQASSMATYHADKLLVSALVSPAAAGAYAICTNIANKILLVAASGATFTFPRSARHHAEARHDAVIETYVLGTRASLLVVVCLATPLIALGPVFLSIWVGTDFANDYGQALRLLGLGYAVAASAVVASNVAVGIGEVALPAVFAFIGGVITLIAAFVLTPRFGATGAAAGAGLGMLQALVFNDIVAKRLGPTARRASWPLIWRLTTIALPVGIVFAFGGVLVEGWISLVVAAAMCIAAVLALWLSTFGRHERLLLFQLWSRGRHAFGHH